MSSTDEGLTMRAPGCVFSLAANWALPRLSAPPPQCSMSVDDAVRL